MCEQCMTDICLFMDRLIEWELSGKPGREAAFKMDVTDKDLAVPATAFREMVEAATGIGYQPGEFMNELGLRSGFKDGVSNWARNAVLPNGLARRVILQCAEMIIRERGAQPNLTLLKAA
jgi:hypothetical protein